jgi:hypothetical protein
VDHYAVGLLETCGQCGACRLSDERNGLSWELVEDERISVHDAGILRRMYLCGWKRLQWFLVQSFIW